MDELKLEPGALFKPCPPESLGFDTTAELPDLDEVLGQERALEAIRFGMGIRSQGFNLYALGASGSGRHTVVEQLVRAQAASEPAPCDYCYVFNFQSPNEPQAIGLPVGMGRSLKRDMNELVNELGSVVPEALESDEYRARRQEFEDVFRDQQGKAFESLQKEAESRNVRLLRTPAGFAFAPMRDGEVIEPDAYNHLPEAEQQEIERQVGELQEKLDDLIQQLPRWRREMQHKIRELNRDVVMSVVGQLVADLRARYAEHAEVIAYFEAVQADIVEHADQFGRSEETVPNLAGMLMGEKEQGAPFMNRYQVNVLIDNSGLTGAPVVQLDNPTFPNLVGTVEHQVQLGALVTDFTMIRAGALHEANGGYLLLDTRKLLMQPYAYEGLKRMLRAREIQIESLGQALSLMSTVALEPERIPLNVKVVLIGDRTLYYMLGMYDEEFNDLFKVAADFDDEMDRTPEDTRRFAAFLGTFTRRENLKPLDAGAVGRLVEHASRMADDSEKLSARFGRVADIIREADYRAQEAGNGATTAADVQGAIDASERRHARIRERLLENTLRGTLLVSTTGSVVGQLNGLSVMQLGEHAFGHPTRITARVRMGKGQVVDIEREVELGGPIHSKGVLILQGYLAGRYCQDRPLTLQASLVFEQSYGGVEGDSASAAELFALLSALAGVPLKQSLAVTGSINQLGQIQPIGGVNEKIEGFFDLCSQRDGGLTGDQGVVIPASNVKHLCLKREVVEAAEQDKFRIYAIESADQGLAVLTGMAAGELDDSGNYPAGTVNQLIETRLNALAEAAEKRAREMLER
ncbi:MAG: ATP-binding protein [Pseudomonadales bacterium]|jgi:lon-related putative ATP-dependent protease